MARLEKFVYRRAAHILVVTEGAKANLVGKGVPGAKITVAPHWYDDADLRAMSPRERERVRAREGWQNRFVVIFAGNMGVLQGLDTVVHACRTLPIQTSVLVVMIGDGVETARLKDLTEKLGVGDRLQFIARQPPSAMAAYFAAADALLVHLRASPLAPLIVPSKTMAYLAAGKPILLAGVGASADIVRKADAGLVVPPDNADTLASALIHLAALPAEERRRMGEQGRRFFEAHFTKQVTLPTYVAALQAAAAATGWNESDG